MTASAYRNYNKRLTSDAVYQHAIGAVLSLIDNETDANHLLQHYDHVSPSLDLSSDWKVSLWFAQMNFSVAKDSIRSIGKNLVNTNRVQINTHDQEFCHLYVFNKSDLYQYGLVDLKNVMDKYSLSSLNRPVAQKGYLAGLNQNSVDFDYKLVVRDTYKVRMNEIPLHYEINELYPNPADDTILKFLNDFCYSVEDDIDGYLRRLIQPMQPDIYPAPTDHDIQKLILSENLRYKLSEMTLIDETN
jgi:hypothetical protein